MKVGARILTAKLKQLRDGIARIMNDLRALWPGQEAIIRQELLQIFQQEGPGWAPLAKSTLKWRRRKGYAPRPILSASQRLRNSLSAGGTGNISRHDRTVLTIGTRVPEAAPNQFGAEVVKYSVRDRKVGINVVVPRSRKGRKNKQIIARIPARPFFKTTEPMTDRLGTNAQTFFAEVVNKIVSQPPQKPKEGPTDVKLTN